jgi:hypothetical protein
MLPQRQKVDDCVCRCVICRGIACPCFTTATCVIYMLTVINCNDVATPDYSRPHCNLNIDNFNMTIHQARGGSACHVVVIWRVGRKLATPRRLLANQKRTTIIVMQGPWGRFSQVLRSSARLGWSAAEVFNLLYRDSGVVGFRVCFLQGV